MPQYYGSQQGPAQYAMHQQSRQDQQMQNMLRMLMQLRALKQDRTQWEQGQAMKQQQMSLSKDQLASIDRYRKAQEKQWEKPPKPPKKPDWWILAQSLVATQQAPDMGTAIMMAKKIKKEKPLDVRVDEASAIADAKAKAQARYRPTPKVSDTTSKPLTPAQNLTNRRLIKNGVSSRWVAIRKDEELADKLDFFRSSDGMHMDMPMKYTVFQAYAKEGIAKPRELEYIAKAELTRQFMDGHPEIYSIEELAPEVKKTLDLATIGTLLEYREKPRKKILGIF